MEVSHMAGVAPLRPAEHRPRVIIICVAALSALGFFAQRAMPYLLLDRQAMARYETQRWWLFVHVAAGAVALLIGPIQLWLGTSRRAMWLHRWLGIVYAAGVAVGSCA